MKTVYYGLGAADAGLPAGPLHRIRNGNYFYFFPFYKTFFHSGLSENQEETKT